MPLAFLIPVAAAVVIALMAWLLLLAAQQLVKFIAHLIPGNIPFIGGWLRHQIEHMLHSALNALSDWLDAALDPLARLISYPVAAIGKLFDHIITTATDVANTVGWVIVHRIPAAISAVQGWAAQRIAYALAVARYELRAAVQTLTHSIAAVQAWAASHIAYAIAVLRYELRAAVQTVERDIYAARLYAAGLVAALHRYVDSLVQAVEARLARAIAAVDHYAHAAYADTLGRIAALAGKVETDIAAAEAAAISTAVTKVDTAVVAGLGHVWGDLEGEFTKTLDWADGAFADVLGGIKGLARDIPTDLIGVSALTGTVELALMRYLRECGLPNCRNLSQLGRDLQALLGLVEGAGMLAFITEMVTNPTGAAVEIESVLGGLADDTVSSARSLFGVS